MHAVVFQQVGGGFQRAGGVDGDHFDIVAQGCRDVVERAAANAAKPVDTYLDRHNRSSAQRWVMLGVL